MSRVWTLFQPVPESNQDPLSGHSLESVVEDDVEVVVHQQEDASDASAEECEFNDCIRTVRVTNLTPSVDRA